MTYALSDLHGDYQSYCQMLKLIEFNENDTLIIIGDICDRGLHSAEIYIDIMSRNNIIALKGNHELMAEKVLPYLFGFEKPKHKAEYKGDYMEWLDNGGASTISSLSKENTETIYDIVTYIKSMPYYATTTIHNKEFVFIHAGIDYYVEEMPLNEYDPFLLVWTRPNYDAKLWDNENKHLVVGHTPTMFINLDATSKIYHGKGSIIAIDCGNAYRIFGGKLGCLCLDTMEEFYI